MENASALSYSIMDSNPDRTNQTVDIEVFAAVCKAIKVSSDNLQTPSYQVIET